MLQVLRTDALAKCNRTIIYGSRLLEALYVLAGEDYHAKRLRPGVGQRIASVEEDPDADQTGDGEPVDGESSAGESSAGESAADDVVAGESAEAESASQGEESSDSST